MPMPATDPDAASSGGLTQRPEDTARRGTAAFALPIGALAVRIGLSVAAVAALGLAAGWMTRGASALSAVGAGVAVVLVGVWGGLTLIQAWKPRPASEWPMLLLGAQGATFACVLGGGLLLYSATHPEPLVYGLVLAAGLMASLIAVAQVFGRAAAGGAGRSHTTTGDASER